MTELSVPVVINGVETTQTEHVFTQEELGLHIKLHADDWEIVSKKQGKHKIGYYNIPCTFDIETTTIPAYKPDGTIDSERTYGYMYHWQFCIIDHVVFGRTWEEFMLLLEMLKKRLSLGHYLHLCIYVHNLGFEFQFMKDFLQISDIFARKARKPLYLRTEDGFEFRCSWFLSNMSLAKFCENSAGCIHYKGSGDEYDYRKIRTPATPMQMHELAYCYNDVRGLAECIQSKLDEGDTIATIPMTSTGYVRRDVRNAMATAEMKALVKKQALTYEQYLLARKVFRGADTHANRRHTGKIIEDVYSVDESSAYPACMLMDYFPMSEFCQAEGKELDNYEWYINRYCCMIRIVLADVTIRPEVAMPYIDIAHAENLVDELADNGRVLSCQYVRLNITEIDWEIIKQQYWYDIVSVETLYYAKRGILPKPLRDVVMEYFRGKTMLKGDGTKQYEYMKSKNKLNSIFGMMVTDIITPEVTYVNHEWGKHSYTEEEAREKLEKHYKYKAFISYQWGIWITAHGRRRLNSVSGELRNDNIYQDTDSKKFTGKHHLRFFEQENEKIRARAEECGAYVDHNGKRYYLGTWDNDGKYDRFRTWGSKKYAYETGGKLHTTVAGMSKAKAPAQIGTLDNFKLGETWHDVGRTVSVYNEEYPHKIIVNSDTFTTASNIGVVDTTYQLGVSDTYFDLIANNILTF